MKAGRQFTENPLYITSKQHWAAYVKRAFKSAMTAITKNLPKNILQGLYVKQ
jgi:hypothetical protein